jgi:hypothetical protein
MNDYKWKMLLWLVVISLLTISCVTILKVAETINNNIRPQNSLSIWEDGDCFVYGDNIEYANICKELSKNVTCSNIATVK